MKLPTIKIKGDCVDDGGEKRELEFYNGLVIVGDWGCDLYNLRFLPDGSLEITAPLSTVRHGDKRYVDKLIIRPEGAGRVLISRDEYKG